ncbi:uncharacterized protein N7511_009120 [Penicillium nucicola]|uniref:uncharacterized protein n=1 Tax=Penicillium nucicola TaxID=1850975 RepID=UPI00254530B9|nr:uncharacterized protein N7511_009120 [Penicillium nucicola]KAJ5747424.1 hypothetical protein N7511_009120 [Penicillium nucicola]
MASYFETFMQGCSKIIEDRFQEAPFQTFVLLACTYMLSIPAVLVLILRYWPSSQPDTARPRLKCRSCGSTDIAEGSNVER